ncbi:MAG: type II secretion system protein GspG [Phycisphaerales bacterium]|nr:MAG: type II secretion system protein GspG [Phycisphaerales bacterium]
MSPNTTHSMSHTGSGTRRRRARGGFSLLELMLVLAIIGILMAVAAFNVLGMGAKGKVTATQSTLNTIKSALDSYILQYSSAPNQLNVLIQTKFLSNKKLQDGWGTNLNYEPRPGDVDRPYLLTSSGPDMQVGTPDDIDVWLINAPETPANP